MKNVRNGAVVLYDNGWNHSSGGRPHVVIHICPSRGVRLCPVTSTGDMRQDTPIPARPGGFRYRSWVAATDAQHTRNQMLWVDPSHLGRTVGQLTDGELTALKMAAVTQLSRRKSRAFTTV